MGFHSPWYIGCRVESAKDIRTNNGSIPMGAVGSIVIMNDGEVGVRWDLNIGGHDLWGKCEYGHGWFFREDDPYLHPSQEDNAEYEESTDMIDFLSGLTGV